jgi:hypothetical protein
VRRFRAWGRRFLSLFAKKRSDAEFDAEIESYLQLYADDNSGAGQTPEEVRRQACIALGGRTAVKERYRDERGFPVLENALRDLRFAARNLAKNPGFSLTAVLTLAVGIGANTLIATLLYGLLFRSLPVPDAGALARGATGNSAKDIFSRGTIFCVKHIAWTVDGGSVSIRQRAYKQSPRSSLARHSDVVLRVDSNCIPAIITCTADNARVNQLASVGRQLRDECVRSTKTRIKGPTSV